MSVPYWVEVRLFPIPVDRFAHYPDRLSVLAFASLSLICVYSVTPLYPTASGYSQSFKVFAEAHLNV